MAVSTETNEMRAERSDVGTVVKLKFKENLIDENGFVDIRKLTYHPVNEMIYPESCHQDDIALLMEKMKDYYETYGVANHTVIVICRKTGVIFSGNFRVRGAKLLGYTHLRAEYCVKEYDPNTPEHEEIIFLKSWNQDGKRPENKPSTALRLYDALRNSYYDAHNKKYTSVKRGQFAKEVGIQKDEFTKLVTIYDKAPHLIKKIEEGMSINRALKDANEDEKDKKIINPNRYNFYEALDKYPSILTNAREKFTSMLESVRSMENGIIFDPVMKWEANQITGVISNCFMSAFVYGFNSVGLKELGCQTPDGKQNYADIHFEYLTNLAGPKYLTERIEVKACSWIGNASSTFVYGGLGSTGVTPHEYIIVVWNKEFRKIFAMMATLSKEDWVTDSANRNAKMALSKWFNDHEKKNDYVILMGDMFKGNKTIEMGWADI